MSEFYDGTKLLSMVDLEGYKPELYLCVGNRSAGKTTFFIRMQIKRFLRNNNEKFIIMYRYINELCEVSEKIFKDVGDLFFKDYEMIDKSIAKGAFRELLIKRKDDEEFISCGYAIAINSADNIKKYSHFFKDCTSIFFDEFMSETNHYCPDEITKFQSIHYSIARGHGKHSRYLPVYMVANQVSLLNPYYATLEISARINSSTKFLKGTGWVLEQNHNPAAAQELINSRFSAAFSSTNYLNYATNFNEYLNDNNAFISKENLSKYHYRYTLKYKDKYYGIWSSNKTDETYINDNGDNNYKIILSADLASHTNGTLLLPKTHAIYSSLRNKFNSNKILFSSLESKNAFLKFICY